MGGISRARCTIWRCRRQTSLALAAEVRWVVRWVVEGHEWGYQRKCCTVPASRSQLRLQMSRLAPSYRLYWQRQCRGGSAQLNCVTQYTISISTICCRQLGLTRAGRSRVLRHSDFSTRKCQPSFRRLESLANAQSSREDPQLDVNRRKSAIKYMLIARSLQVTAQLSCEPCSCSVDLLCP